MSAIRLVCRLWCQIAITNSNWMRFAQQILRNSQYDWTQTVEPHNDNVFRDTLAHLTLHRDNADSTQSGNTHEHELYLPRENIRKVMKKVLPSFAKVK